MADLKTYRPAHLTAVGSPGQHARVLFREGLYIELDQFAQENADREYGAVLLGIRRRPEGSSYDEILINGFLPFPQRYHLQRFRLGETEMEEMHLKRRTFYPDLDIVGWIHTHPGFGIFLSKFDREQHMQFFPEAWQLAFVVDPQNMTRGLYQFSADEPVQLNGYYLADLPPAKAVLKRKAGAKKSGRRRRLNLRRFAGALVVIVFFLVAVSYGGMMVWERLSNGGPARTESDAPASPSTPAATVPTPPTSTVVQQPEPPPADNLVVPRTEPAAVPETAEPAPDEEPETAPPREYVVRAGDSLWAIANRELGNPERYREIMELNDMSTNTVLRVGMVLQLPDVE